CRIVRIARGVGAWTRPPAGAVWARPAILRGFGSCERPFWRREPKEPNPCRPVPSKTPATSRALLPKRGAPSQTHRRGASPRLVRLIQRKLHRSPLHRRRIGAAKTPVKAEDPRGERVTKQERMLTLLSQPA